MAKEKQQIADPTSRAVSVLKNHYGLVDKEIRKWLTGVPASDVNFIGRLKRANVATIKSALRDPKLTMTARSRMEQRLRAIKREQEQIPF